QGRPLPADVVAVDQPLRNRYPCNLTIHTNQEVLRIRRGTQIETRDGGVRGRVRDVSEDPAGGTLIDMRLEKGVRVGTRPRVGQTLHWVDSAVYEGSFLRSAIYREMKDLALPAVYGQQLPGPLPRR